MKEKNLRWLNGELDKTYKNTRRFFLQSTAAGILAIAVLGTGCTLTADLEEEDAGDKGVSPLPNPRVVRLIDSEATSWSEGDSFDDFFQYADQDVVDEMVERGLVALTGAGSLKEAWETLVPYQEGELVAIHLNAHVNNENGEKNNIYQPISAIVYGLVDLLEIPPEKVAISDPSRTFKGNPASEARLIDECRHADDLAWDLYRGEYGSKISFTKDRTPPGEFAMARLMEEAAHIIQVPVLSWHDFNWITGALKMTMGCITNMPNLHPGGETEYEWRDGARLADINMPIKDKVRLIVADGLFGNIDGNSQPPHPFETLGGEGGKHPSSTLYFSQDPVAIDCVMYDDLLDEADAADAPKGGYFTGFLEIAADADHQLGTFEMRAETGNDGYEAIELVEE